MLHVYHWWLGTVLLTGLAGRDWTPHWLQTGGTLVLVPASKQQCYITSSAHQARQCILLLAMSALQLWQRCTEKEWLV